MHGLAPDVDFHSSDDIILAYLFWAAVLSSVHCAGAKTANSNIAVLDELETQTTCTQVVHRDTCQLSGRPGPPGASEDPCGRS